jgi:hypothetical protein
MASDTVFPHAKPSGVADHVVFLMTVNQAWTKARLRIARKSGFGLRTLLFVDTPKHSRKADFSWVRFITKKGGLVRLNLWITRRIRTGEICK